MAAITTRPIQPPPASPQRCRATDGWKWRWRLPGLVLRWLAERKIAHSRERLGNSLICRKCFAAHKTNLCGELSKCETDGMPWTTFYKASASCIMDFFLYLYKLFLWGNVLTLTYVYIQERKPSSIIYIELLYPPLNGK